MKVWINSKTFSQFQVLKALFEYYRVTKVFHISVAIQRTGSILFQSTNYEPQIFQKRMSNSLFIKLDRLKPFASKNLSYSYLVFSATFLNLQFSVSHKKLHLEAFVTKCKIKKFKNSPRCSVVASRNFVYQEFSKWTLIIYYIRALCMQQNRRMKSKSKASFNSRGIKNVNNDKAKLQINRISNHLGGSL